MYTLVVLALAAVAEAEGSVSSGIGTVILALVIGTVLFARIMWGRGE